MKHKKQKESKWILGAAVILIGTGLALRIDWQPKTLTFYNEPMTFTVNQAEAKTDEPKKELSIEERIRKAWADTPDADLAVKVAKCESQMEAKRIGDTHLAKPSIGIFQINQIWHEYSTEYLQDPDNNIQVARDIYDRSGGNFNRWSCYRFGYYHRYDN